MYRHVTLSALSMLALTGCPDFFPNTGTQLPPSNPWSGVDELYSAGITPAAAPGCLDADGQAVLRFAMRDLDRRAVTESSFEDANSAFVKEAIRFENSALFELPNVSCEASTCSGEGWRCGAPPGVTSQDWQRCHVNDEDLLTIAGDPTFVSQTDKRQLFGVMLELTRSWRGELPEAITNLNPDLDEDGRGDTGAALALQRYNNERATDPRDIRMVLMGTLLKNWLDASKNADELFLGQTYFGYWTFGAVGLLAHSQIAHLYSTTESIEFITSRGRAHAAVNGVSGNDGFAEQAAIYESMVTVLESTNGYASPEFVDAEKVLTIVVDGPDELRLPAFDVERVIAAAQAVDARVFIVHVDSAVETTATDAATGAELSLFPDDPDYIERQGGGFASEADCDCRDYETCRAVTQYSTQPGDSNEIPNPASSDRLYCVPKRDAEGRIGPIADYGRIACATGGAYLYVPDIADLARQAGWIPYTLYGLWEVPVDVDLSTHDGDAFLIQSDLTVNLDGTEHTFAHAPNPDALRPGDSRMILFTE